MRRLRRCHPCGRPAPIGSSSIQLAELAVDAVVVTCRSRGRVARTLPWLEQQGYDVANLDGDLRAWDPAGKPMEIADGSEPQVP